MIHPKDRGSRIKDRLAQAAKHPYRFRVLASIAIVKRLDRIIELLERDRS